VAGQFDGSEIGIYLDGILVGKKAAAGQRTLNKLPLIVGGDPDQNGRGVDTLIGKIDGVRISSTARYGVDPFIAEVDPEVDEETLYQLSFDCALAGMVQVERGSGQMPTVGQLVGAGRCEEGAARKALRGRRCGSFEDSRAIGSDRTGHFPRTVHLRPGASILRSTPGAICEIVSPAEV
jgi:hypothetical protein